MSQTSPKKGGPPSPRSKEQAHVALRRSKVAQGDDTTGHLSAVLEPLPGSKHVVQVLHEHAGQHSLTWETEVSLPVSVNGKPAKLPPGTCNLYHYPRVFFAHLRKDKEVVPKLEELFVLEEIIRALVLKGDESSSITHKRDGAGAAPLHGLVVANTKQSLALALSLYKARPALLQQSHTSKVFFGENSLHILCVNRREPELVELVELAARKLKPKQLQEIFWKHASGLFFQDEPMAYYGGTPVNFAVAFSMEGALRTMLRCTKTNPSMKGIINFNDPAISAGRLLGLMPIHVAVANSLTSMYNFLVDLPGLPIEFDDMRAQPQILSQFGVRTDLALMQPLQVATKLGDKKLVQYILRTQSKLQWVWGPASAYHLDLRGIDSCGDTANDMMEICARLDAREETQEMLLDTFMAGLLHELFEQKYSGKRLKYVHYAMRLLDATYLVSLWVLGIVLRVNCEDVLYPKDGFYRVLPYVTLFSIVPMLLLELHVSSEYWGVTRGAQVDPSAKQLLEGGARGRLRLIARDLGMLTRWMQSHNMWLKFVGWSFATGALCTLLEFRRWPLDDSRWDASFLTVADRLDWLLVPISLAAFLHATAFFKALLLPLERINVFYMTCFQMLSSDVKNWIVLFAIFLFNYGLVMFIVYPRFRPDGAATLPIAAATPEALAAASALEEPVPQLTDANFIQALIELALIGERVEVDALIGLTQGVDTMRAKVKLSLFCVFLSFYAFYVIMTLVLLLNLLIAMMGDTFNTVQERATREYRVNFARGVLRLELQMLWANRMGLMTLNCGERVGKGKDATYVYAYRNYVANAEGGGTRGAKASMFDDEVEKEADEDAEDDGGPGGGSLDDTLHAASIKAAAAAAAASKAGGDSAAKLRSVGKAIVLIAPLEEGEEKQLNGSVSKGDLQLSVDDVDGDDV